MHRCSVGRALAEATPNQREIAELIIDDREGYDQHLLPAALAEVLESSVGTEDVFDHRNGDCSCALAAA